MNAPLQPVTYVEIDVDYCALSFGVSPCSATGPVKCFNTPATCPVINDYQDDPVTLRFSMAAEFYSRNIDALPLLTSYDLSPGKISLGENLGERKVLTLTFKNAPHSDVGPGFDKYHAERDYDPYKQGTLWGKFAARQPYLVNRPLRLIRGYAGQTLDQMETRNYIIASFSDPSPDGRFQIVAKDILKFADGDRSQAPNVSEGYLSADIDNSVTSFTLNPPGVGATYGAAGYINIGGKEICSFTRSSDTMTIVRGRFNTIAVAHSAQDLVQECLHYDAEKPSAIIEDLLVNYSGVPADFIPSSEWETEIDVFSGQVYTALIAKPTSTKSLITEMIVQAGLAIWTDDIHKKIRLQVLRQIATDAYVFDMSNILEKSFSSKQQPDKRIAEVWTYFGQIDPLKSLDDFNNYRSVARSIHLENIDNYRATAIKKIYSRWIPAGGRSRALAINERLIARYNRPPRLLTFSAWRAAPVLPQLGGGYRVSGWQIEDAFGIQKVLPAQIVSEKIGDDAHKFEAEEAFFDAVETDPSNRTIVIDYNTYNLNLRELHDTLFVSPGEEDELTVKFYILENNKIGSTSTASPALNVGDWPDGVEIEIYLLGKVQGKGGDGGAASGYYLPQYIPVMTGKPGGVALFTRKACKLYLSEGVARLWGGGGGGAGTPFQPGAGGAGLNPGARGSGSVGLPSDATETTGGKKYGLANPYSDGDGGDPGEAGEKSGDGWTSYSGYNCQANGGAAGAAIDGVSFVEIVGTGDRRGPEVN